MEMPIHYMNEEALTALEKQLPDLVAAGMKAWAETIQILIDNLRSERNDQEVPKRSRHHGWNAS